MRKRLGIPSPLPDQDRVHILETDIIDTGIGITKERQKLLFQPFLELKMKQNLNQVKDGSIGIGLACSKLITEAMKGDITIKKSKNGLSVFSFKIPVRTKDKPRDDPIQPMLSV
jgi:signal transduction histidine kinase